MPQLAFVAGLQPFVPDAQDRDRLFLKLRRLGIATDRELMYTDWEALLPSTDPDRQAIHDMAEYLYGQHDCSPVSIDLRCDSSAPTVDIQHHFGIPAIDRLLRGGVGAGDILEVVGTSDSGRTLLVHLMCSETVYQHARARVIYVDTAAWFSVELLLDCLRYTWSRARDPNDTASGRTDFGRLSASPALVDSADNDPENSDGVIMRTTPFARASLERVQHVHCATADEVLAFIAGVMSTPVDEDVDFKGDAMPRPTLYVFDCLAPLLVTYLNSSAQGHSLVVTLSRALRSLSHRPHTAVVFTNSASTRVRDRGRSAGGVITDLDLVSQPRLQPALGLNWTYTADTTIFVCDAGEDAVGGAVLHEGHAGGTGNSGGRSLGLPGRDSGGLPVKRKLNTRDGGSNEDDGDRAGLGRFTGPWKLCELVKANYTAGHQVARFRYPDLQTCHTTTNRIP